MENNIRLMIKLEFPFFNSSIEDINSGKVLQKNYLNIRIAKDTKHELMIPK